MDAHMRSDLRTLQHFSEQDPELHKMHTHTSDDQANYIRLTELAWLQQAYRIRRLETSGTELENCTWYVDILHTQAAETGCEFLLQWVRDSEECLAWNANIPCIPSELITRGMVQGVKEELMRCRQWKWSQFEQMLRISWAAPSRCARGQQLSECIWRIAWEAITLWSKDVDFLWAFWQWHSWDISVATIDLKL